MMGINSNVRETYDSKHTILLNYKIFSPFTYVILLKSSIIFINHNTIQSMKLYACLVLAINVLL